MRKTHNCIHDIRYRVIFVTSGRKPLITPAVAKTILGAIKDRCKRSKAKLVSFTYAADRADFVLRTPLKHTLSDDVNPMKTSSSRRARRDHPETRDGPRFWEPSYLVLTHAAGPEEGDPADLVVSA